MFSKGYPVNPGDLAISSQDWAEVPPNPNRTGSVGYEGTPGRSEQPLSEVNCGRAQAEVTATDSGEVLRPYSTDEGGEPQGSRSGAATVSIGGKGEAAGRIEKGAPERGTEPGRSGQTPLARLTELAKDDPTRRFSSIARLLTAEALYEAFARQKKKAAEGVDCELRWRGGHQALEILLGMSYGSTPPAPGSNGNSASGLESRDVVSPGLDRACARTSLLRLRETDKSIAWDPRR